MFNMPQLQSAHMWWDAANTQQRAKTQERAGAPEYRLFVGVSASSAQGMED